MNDTAAYLREHFSEVIADGIAPVFRPGAKITLIVRTPGNDEADFLLTTDELADLQALLARSVDRERATPAQPQATGSQHAEGEA